MQINWQVKLLVLLGIICLLITFLLDFRGLQSTIVFIASLAFVYFGNKLYEEDTSENWLNFSLFGSARNIIGGVLILSGWALFLRGVLTVAIASLILWLG